MGARLRLVCSSARLALLRTRSSARPRPTRSKIRVSVSESGKNNCLDRVQTIGILKKASKQLGS